MLTDDQLSDALADELDALVCGLTPSPDLADRVVRRRRASRRRTRIAGALATGGVVAAAAGAIALATGGSAAPARGPDLHLASFSFSLPSGSHSVPRTASATSPSCALGAYVVYTPGPGEGAGDAGQQAIANAVTGAGGCVSMLLTDPYTPGAANAPRSLYYPLQTSSVTIDGHSGTIGTYEFLGGPGTVIHGVQVPSGTENTELTLQVPAPNGQVQELQVATAGLSEQQLESIVSSGLQAGATS